MRWSSATRGVAEPASSPYPYGPARVADPAGRAPARLHGPWRSSSGDGALLPRANQPHRSSRYREPSFPTRACGPLRTAGNRLAPPLRERAARRPSPTPVRTPSAGTARRAARGDSTSSNSGTGSPMRSPSGPSGQSPRFAPTSKPSLTKAAIAGRNNDPRRPLSAHHHTYAIAARNAIAIRPCAARQTTTAGDKAALDREAGVLRIG